MSGLRRRRRLWARGRCRTSAWWSSFCKCNKKDWYSVVSHPLYPTRNNLGKLTPPEPLTPYDYFKQYVPSQMFELMSTMTNIYAEQKGVKGYKHASASEMEFLVSLHMEMGMLDFPIVRMYWSSSINIGIFRETLSWGHIFNSAPACMLWTTMKGLLETLMCSSRSDHYMSP